MSMVITQIKINSKKGKKKKNLRYTTKAHHVTPIV